MSELHLAEGSPFPPKQPGKLRLYGMLFCPYVERTRLVLAHKNIPFETVNVNLKSKPAWFFEKNHLGLVPVLEVDDKIVTESTATCDWLDDTYPQDRLTPTDPYKKAKDRMEFEYFPKVTSSYMGLVRGKSDEEKQEMATVLAKHIKYYDDVLTARGDGPFFGGQKPSMLDFLLWPHFERISAAAAIHGFPEIDEISTGKLTKLAAWFQAMHGIPAVKAVMFDKDTHIRYMKSSLAGKPDYDMFAKKE